MCDFSAVFRLYRSIKKAFFLTFLRACFLRKVVRIRICPYGDDKAAVVVFGSTSKQLTQAMQIVFALDSS